MSGIVGVFRRDGSSVATHDVSRMLETIRHRGPDASAIWTGGPAGLGNCILRTTPESLDERLPLESLSDPFVIAADARIDNRAELISALRITADGKVLTDSDLILRAYAVWGEGCVERLIGDFSFAIWNRRDQSLFCARDSSGLRSLYYFASAEMFAFASEIKGLIALPGVPAVLDEQRVGDYLINLFEDREITFYKGVKRLPAAHSLVVSRERLATRNYWKLDPSREIRLSNGNEYTEAFREIFDEAVKCRMRSAFPVGSALSGGLDSSAIACSARNFAVARDPSAKLPTFSVIFPEAPEQDLRSIDERRYIDSVLNTGNFDPHFIRGDRLSPMADGARVHHHLDEPNFAPNLYLHWGMYAAAQESGVRVFLDGLDGDTTVSHGFEYLEELAREFKWRRLHSEASQLAKNLFQNSSARRILWRYCFRDMAPNWTHMAWRLLHGRFRELRGNSTLAQPEFTRHLQLRRRARTLLKTPRPKKARDYHFRGLTYALYAHTMEMADKATAAFGIEARYPFFDRRLIEFCLAVPANQKLAGGWNRSIFRRAMQGVLPQEIQWRPGKGNLSSNFHRKLLDFEKDTLGEIVSRGAPRIGKYVDVNAMRRSLQSYEMDPLGAGGKHSIELFSAANLALWMEQSGIKAAAATEDIDTLDLRRHSRALVQTP